MVAPDLQGQGLGRVLLEAVEAAAPADADDFVLFTGAGSARQPPVLQARRLPAAAARSPTSRARSG